MKLILSVTLLSCITQEASAGFLQFQDADEAAEATAAGAAEAAAEAEAAGVTELETIEKPEHIYSEDCGMSAYLRVIPSLASMLQKDSKPGAGIDGMHNAQLDGVFQVKNGTVKAIISEQVKTYARQLAKVTNTVVLTKDLPKASTIGQLKTLIVNNVLAWKGRQDIVFVFEDGTTAKDGDHLKDHKAVAITWQTKFAPFLKVWKDGYSQVNCVKDYMFYHGDKYGDHKDEYELGFKARVSIVHYDAFIALKDRERMTPKVCFDFCRTVPDMVFFGITTAAKVNQCYCMPYFEQMAGDSSQCDSPCEGDGNPGCGGDSKSSIFTMRSCDNTLSDLGEAESDARHLRDALDQTILELENYIALIDGAAADMIPLFGHVGDSVATGLAQYARNFGMFATKEIARGKKLKASLDFLYQENGDHGSKLREDVKDNKMVTRAESLVKETQETVATGVDSLDKLNEMVKTIHPEISFRSEFKALAAYRPVMYFVNSTFDGANNPGRDVKELGDETPAPTTCEGENVGAPIVDLNLEDCAMACDQMLVHGCKAFQHFDNKGYGDGKTRRQLCFLFSSFSNHQGHYYTGCKESPKGIETNLRTGCWAKFSKFAGGKFEGSGTLKPDPRARTHPLFCKECFKSFTKYDRCYTALTDKKGRDGKGREGKK